MAGSRTPRLAQTATKDCAAPTRAPRDPALPDPQWHWELDTQLRYTAAGAFTGRKGGPVAADLLGKRPWELPAAGAARTDWPAHRRALEARQPFRDIEYACSGVDGEPRRFCVSGEPGFDAHGTFCGYRGIALDISRFAGQGADAGREAGPASARRGGEAATCQSEAATCQSEAATCQSEAATRQPEAASERSLRALLSNLPGFAYRCANDAARTPEFASDGVLALTGFPATQFVAPRGMTLADLIHPADCNAALAAVQAALAKGEAFEIEYRIRTREGGEKWVWDRGQALRSAQGDIVGVEGLLSDISGRKSAADALRASEARFQDFARASGDWFWETDADGRLTWISDSVERFTGTPASWFLGKRPQDLKAASDDGSGEAWQRRRQAGEQRVPYRNFTYRLRHRNGKVSISSNGVPRFDAQGAFLGYRGAATDVTERLRAERAARLAEVRLRGAIESLSEPVLLTDAEDRIVLMNRAGRAAYPAAEVGAPYETILREEAARGEAPQAATQAWIEQRMASRRAGSGSYEWPRSDDRWTLISEQRLPEAGTVTFFFDITERKRAARALEALNRGLERRVAERTAALAESEASLRVVVNEAPAGIASIAPDGRLLEVNQRFCEILGYARQELLGRPHLELAHPTDSSAGAAVAREMLAGNCERYALEQRYLRKDGSTVWANLSAAAVHDASGEYRYAIAVLEDITERKRHDQALREREEQLRVVTENIPAMVVHFDARGVCRYANTRYAMAVGRTGAQMIGLRYEEILSPTRVAEETGRRRRVLEGHTVRFERTSHDGLGVNEISLVPYFDLEGTQDGYFGFIVDITEHKRQASSLRESEERLRHVIDLVPHFVFAKDAQGLYLFSNLAHAAFYGKAPADLLGRRAAQAGMPAAEAAYAEAAEAGVRSRGRRREFPERLVRNAKGEARLFWEVRMPMRYATEAEDAVLTVAIDITELKTAQTEVEKLNVELEARVAARTSQLAAANREMESFSYSISHDLRAPVRAVSGFAGILIQDHAQGWSDEARGLAERIAGAGARMGEMIDGLLELARLSRSAPSFQAVDLAALAREVWSEVIADEPRRRVAFSAPAACTAECDPVLIRNVLQNLLGNAFKSTRRTPFARVEFGMFDGGEGRTFFVRDNGAGFDTAYADKLFGTFQRLHKTSEFEGTGVGLATAQRIIERHAGRIWGESSPGEGASFQFTLGPAQLP